MPKLKSRRSAAKRFSIKKSGKIKRGSAFRSHILTKMTTKSKRKLRAPSYVAEADLAAVRRMI